MATKPVTLPSWGTDTNFSSGAETGSPVKVEPSAGAKSQGWVPGQPFRGPRLNWWQNLVYQWAVYLDDLHNSSAFLGASYTWTGTQALGGSVEGTYSAARTRTMFISLAGASHDDDWYFDGPTVTWKHTTGTATDSVSFRLDLPHDSIMTGFRVGVTQSGGHSTSMTAQLLKKTPDTVTGADGALSGWGLGTSAGSGDRIISSVALNETIDRDTCEYTLQVTGSDGVVGEDVINWVEITFTELRATGHY
jgi:hypothetical protein